MNKDSWVFQANKAVVRAIPAFIEPNPASVGAHLAPGCIQLWLRCVTDCFVGMNLCFVDMDKRQVGAYQSSV